MKKMIIMALPLILLAIAFRSFTSQVITGAVHDEKGNGIPGCSIRVKGSKTATSSAADGTFRLEVENLNVTLIFSSVGFATQEIKLKGKQSLAVNLKPVQASLDEVVVVGYGRADGLAIKSKNYSSPATNNLEEYEAYDTRKTADIDDQPAPYNTEGYDHITENRFLKVSDNPLSTFSIDVDAASYSNVRRFLNQGQLPPAGAVRIEEMINYFHYEYPQPGNDQPFSINTEIADCPWNKDNKLVLIGLQGKNIPTENLPPSNIVFLIDVSGSMDEPTKLPLVKASMKMLVDQLREQDRIAMVVYAGNAGLVLPSTSGAEKQKIKDAIDRLDAGGSTAGGEGINLAYKIAEQNKMKEGNNRVILCTDGDFNVGPSSDDEMERLIEEKRKSGVFLTVLGFGTGNYQDSKMEKLADKGNGNHAYIDGLSEAKKVLVNEFGGTLFTIAKDVKLQVEFNPAKVQGYRLIGYENRMLNKEDFNNDKKDAGELGSGHTVTALYEVIPAGIRSGYLEKVDSLKYQSNIVPLSPSSHSGEIMTVKFRYKKPDGDVGQLIEHPVSDQGNSFVSTSDNFRFAAAVSEFGMLLRNSEFKSNSSFTDVLKIARKAKGSDEEGYRAEFIHLVENAQTLARNDKNNKPDEEDDVSSGRQTILRIVKWSSVFQASLGDRTAQFAVNQHVLRINNRSFSQI